MEVLKFRARTFDNYLEIIPEEGFEDNCVYEIRLKDIKSTKGNILENTTLKLCTEFSPMYVDILAVKTLISRIDIEDETIMYNIREASKFADYVSPDIIDKNNVPYKVTQLVRYKAAYECLLNYIISISSTNKLSGTVGDVVFSESESSKDLTDLLKTLADLIDEWTDAVKGYELEGRAKMKAGVKSSTYIDYNFQKGTPVPAFENPHFDLNRGV